MAEPAPANNAPMSFDDQLAEFSRLVEAARRLHMADSVQPAIGVDEQGRPVAQVGPERVRQAMPDSTGVVAGQYGLPPMEPGRTEGERPITGAPPLPQNMVSVPNYTLGGKRMEGARPMTVQEQTMADSPLLQMGRDAGAFGSRAVNAAGLGVPGMILDYAAPETSAAIRGNERVANGIATGLGDIAGMAGSPLSLAGKGIAKGGRAAYEGFAALPKPVQGAVAFAPAGLGPTEAAGPESAPKGEFVPPSAGSELWSGLKEFAKENWPALKKMPTDGGTPDAPLSADDFKQSRRTIQAKTLEQILAEEKDKVRTDPTYGYGPVQRGRLDLKAEADAKKRYDASKGDLDAQDARLNKEYADYVAGWNTQRDAHYNKQFTERHPNLAMALTVGGPLASAALTKGVFGRVDAKGTKIADAGLKARADDDVGNLAQSLVKADSYKPWKAKTAAAAEAALLPAELRATQDFVDAKGLPPTAGARKAAEARMEDTPKYVGGMWKDAVSGGIGAASGVLLNKRFGPGSPKEDLATLQSYGRGLPVNTSSPDQLTEALATRIAATKAAQSKISPPISTAPTSGSSAPTASPRSAQPGQAVQGSSPTPPAQTPIPTSQAFGQTPVPQSPLAGGGLTTIPPPMPGPQAQPPTPAANQSPLLSGGTNQPTTSDILSSIKRAERDMPNPMPPAPASAAGELPKGMKYGTDGKIYWSGGPYGGHKVDKEILDLMELKNKPQSKAPKPSKTDDGDIPLKPSVQMDDTRPLGSRRSREED